MLSLPASLPAEAPGWMGARPRPVLIPVAGAVLALALGAFAAVNFMLALAALAGIALVVAVMLRPLIGGLVLIGVVPVTSGLAPGVPVPYVRTSELLIGVVGGTLLLTARRSDVVRWGVVDWLLLAYGTAWAAFGTFADLALHQHLTVSDWGTVLGQFQFVLLYRGVRVALRTTRERRLALKVLLAASVPVVLLAALQQLRVGAVTSLLTSITAGGAAPVTSGIHRATGPFDNWAALAGYLFPLLLVLFALTINGALGRHRRAALAVAILALLGLLLTAELSAIICLLVGCGALVLARRPSRQTLRWMLLGVVVVAAVTGPFLAERVHDQLAATAGSNRKAEVPQTISFRWQVWEYQYLPAIGARPATGYGVELPDSVAWQYPESQYISLLMEGGIPLLALFALLTWAMAARARRSSRSDDAVDAAVGSALFVVVLAVVAMNGIWPYFSNGGLPQVLWCLFALGGSGGAPRAVPARRRNRETAMPSPNSSRWRQPGSMPASSGIARDALAEITMTGAIT